MAKLAKAVRIGDYVVRDKAVDVCGPYYYSIQKDGGEEYDGEIGNDDFKSVSRYDAKEIAMHYVELKAQVELQEAFIGDD